MHNALTACPIAERVKLDTLIVPKDTTAGTKPDASLPRSSINGLRDGNDAPPHLARSSKQHGVVGNGGLRGLRLLGRHAREKRQHTPCR